MGLFGSYQNAGPGINPYAPKKKPFFRFWELMWRSLGKLLSLNILHTLLHAPLFLSLIVFLETDNAMTVPFSIGLLVIQFFLEGPIMAGCTRVLRLIVFWVRSLRSVFPRTLCLLFWCGSWMPLSLHPLPADTLCTLLLLNTSTQTGPISSM